MDHATKVSLGHCVWRLLLACSVVNVSLFVVLLPSILYFDVFTEPVQECVELVSRAQKPVILVGSQATLPPTPVETLRASLEVRTFEYIYIINKKHHLVFRNCTVL